MSIAPDNLKGGDDPVALVLAVFSGLMIFPGIVDLMDGCLKDYPHRIHVDLVDAAAGGLSTVKITKFRDL